MKANRIIGTTDAQRLALDRSPTDKARGQYDGHTFRTPRQAPSTKLAPGIPPPRNSALRPRRPPGSQSNSIDAETSSGSNDQNGAGGLPDDLRALFHDKGERQPPRLPVPGEDSDAGQQFGDGAGGDRGATGEQRPAGETPAHERRPGVQPRTHHETPTAKAVSTARLPEPTQHAVQRTAQQLLQMGLPGAVELFGPKTATPPTQRSLLDALMSLLIAAAGARAEPARVMPSLTSVTLAAVQAHLARRPPGEAPLSLSLGQVKELLLARSKQLPQTDGLPAATVQRIENCLLLMPLMALNPSRPRTPQQCQLAQDRIGLMRASGGL